MRITSPKYTWRSYAYGSISLCMIMKNEEKRLPRCLNSVRGLVDDIIICDTGSTDRSIEIAKSFGSKVFSDPWQDDFARPRNLSLTRASGDWILILDPDEIILRKDHQAIKELTRSKKFVAFQLTTFNYGRNPRELGYRTLLQGLDPSGQFTGFVPSTKTRLFKNGLGIRFIGCWHELVDWYLIQKNLPKLKVEIPIHHWAHEISQTSREAKTAFYLRLGEKKVKQMPNLNQAWWELAVAEAIAGLRYRAARHIEKAISLGFKGPNTLATLSRIYRLLGNKKKADLAFEKSICMLFPNLTHLESDKRTLHLLTKDK